ncbi:DUF7545 family protein [Haloarchaeobius sp. HME9146]|uniref:DUF7545 family protein n=1 Tax=unclassified Haloarchaeobius TaxID=2614452 RepID=UPI0021C086A9|nr:hypothetical protein [Haloarchaeobius sp. HME9146]MCT9096938.1 hypothetical protein [Haloarchaeobius sp. HME9146]
MADDIETVTFSIESEDDSDEVTLPKDLLSLLAEGDQSPAEVVGDIAMLSFASRAHHIAHHGEEDSEELDAVEQSAMDLFEERFGVSFGEATGHQH